MRCFMGRKVRRVGGCQVGEVCRRYGSAGAKMDRQVDRLGGIEAGREVRTRDQPRETRVVEVRPGRESLDFLGYTFRWDRDLRGRSHKYLNVLPSAKAVAREREKLRAMTNARQCHTPIPELVSGLNRHLNGWANYFCYGYPRGAWWEIDWFVRGRLIQHLQRRSQRPYRPPKGVRWYDHIQKFGLVLLTRLSGRCPVHA